MKASKLSTVSGLKLSAAFVVSSAEVIEQAALALAHDASKGALTKRVKLSKYTFRKVWRYFGHLVSIRLQQCLDNDRGLLVPSLGLFSLDMLGRPT